MADSKCHHPIEFLYPEYANDRYAIQRAARSIGFFFLGRNRKKFVFTINHLKRRNKFTLKLKMF